MKQGSRIRGMARDKIAIAFDWAAALESMPARRALLPRRRPAGFLLGLLDGEPVATLGRQWLAARLSA